MTFVGSHLVLIGFVVTLAVGLPAALLLVANAYAGLRDDRRRARECQERIAQSAWDRDRGIA